MRINKRSGVDLSRNVYNKRFSAKCSICGSEDESIKCERCSNFFCSIHSHRHPVSLVTKCRQCWRMIAKKMGKENRLEEALTIFDFIRDYSEIRLLKDMIAKKNNETNATCEYRVLEFEKRIIKKNDEYYLTTEIDGRVYFDKVIKKMGEKALLECFGGDLGTILMQLIELNLVIPGTYNIDLIENKVKLVSLHKQSTRYWIFQKQVVWSTNKKESVTIFNGNIIVDGHYNQMIRKDRDGLYGPEIVLLLNKILSINIDQPGFFILDLLNDNIYRVDAVKDMYGLEMYNIPDFHNPVQADNMAE